MADSNPTPPRWLKPMNKVPTGISFMKRSGLVIEGTTVFRFDPA
jgi:hypothetical protein